MELVDRFDNKRRSLNKITDRYDNIAGEYKQLMHIWILNDEGKFLIQKRAKNKRVFPGLWSITSGGVEKRRKYGTNSNKRKQRRIRN